MNIEFTNNPKTEDIDFLTQMIDAESPEYDTCVPFAFFIRDTSGAIIAGVNGNTLFGRIYIDQLWVAKAHRKKGLATKLMDEVHNYGRTMDCHMATLTTMNFQNAREFYEKLGYIADFERKGYNDGSSCIFMRKDL